MYSLILIASILVVIGLNESEKSREESIVIDAREVSEEELLAKW